MEFLFVLLATFGLLMTLIPYKLYEIYNTLRFENPEFHEPSVFALILNIIKGIGVIVVALYFLFNMPIRKTRDCQSYENQCTSQ